MGDYGIREFEMTGVEHHLLAEQLARQIFPHAHTLVVGKMESGASTWVYRIAQDEAIFYLRILPEENASFAPEVYVHTSLVGRKLRVPEIVYFEHYNDAFQRSAVATTAIKGVPLPSNGSLETVEPVLRQAGRELALINQLPVDGFGWVQRSAARTDEVRGEHPTFTAWMGVETEQALALFAQQELLSPTKLASLQGLLATAIEQFSHDPPMLAHGDFDTTHIFHLDNEYSGIIDFGEIRGANRLYDLGHFAIENAHFLPALLQGYQEIIPLPVDYKAQIQQASLLVAVHRMGRRAARHASVLAVDRQVVEHALNG